MGKGKTKAGKWKLTGKDRVRVSFQGSQLGGICITPLLKMGDTACVCDFFHSGYFF